MTAPPFLPGTPTAPAPPLARYRPAQPVGAAGAYVEHLTRPGDLVVDLFCQGPAVVREVISLGRRALGLSVNPLLLLAARLGLHPQDATALNSAFTLLADSRKGDVPLRRHLSSLYRSTCPECGTQGVAEWFAWDRDGNYPFRKAVRCPQCGEAREGTPDDDDLHTAQLVKPRSLPYYYALDRVAPPGHPARERAAELVELYTPRNLSALIDMSMRLEGLEATEEEKAALASTLLDCFDAGSSLDPYGEERPRPRTLRIPASYLERNVWLCFEAGFSRLLNAVPVSPAQAVAIDALLGGRAQGYALAGRAAGDVGEIVPAGSADLILADPPRPDGVFWALSALWAGWLWDSPAAHALRPFLRRRRFDWDWHWRVLRRALRAAGPLLTAAGRLVTLFSEDGESLLESVCLAASGAGYVLDGWGHSPEVGYRMLWRWQPQRPGGRPWSDEAGLEALERDLTTVAGEFAVSAVRERGEPAVRSTLHASAWGGLAERRLLARAATVAAEGPSPLALAAGAVHRALEGAPLTRVADREGTGEARWWLAGPGQAAESPLADRVEALVRALLDQRPAWDPRELIAAIYAHFPGHLTPDVALVRVCIDSYSVREGETLRLRPEDQPGRRAAEREALCADLARLGERLDFAVRQGDGWDVCWLEGGQEAYTFAVTATASLAPHLLAGRAAAEGTQRCLALPAARAQLAGLKLQRDPRLSRAVEAEGWQFIMFRHIRRLVAEEELDRHALKTVLGLDPIAEQEAAQIPLF